MNNIQMIKIEKLQPHPDNPRKQIGDVSELANSIRHSGVMQNLTVVPYEGGYRVVIGHRRLAAAKEAGLTELPCLVSDMDEKEQLATMIAENMQRVDLTVPEQVRGVQMLLDLGETNEEVMKTTGLSRTTFYHRKAMAALPADELEKSWERGATLADYIALETIKDAKTKEWLLTLIGTNNFKWSLESAKEKQEYKEKIKEVLVLLEPVAKKLSTDFRKSEWKSVYLKTNDWKSQLLECVKEIETDEDATYYFYIEKNSWDNEMLRIYCGEDRKEPKAKKDSAKEEREREARRAGLVRLHETAFGLRREFVQEFSETESTRHLIASEYLLFGTGLYQWQRAKLMAEVFGIQDEDKAEREFIRNANEQPGRLMLASMIHGVASVRSWDGKYSKDESADRLRDLLGMLGYMESDEEKAYWTGTHELFLKDEEEA